MSKKDKLLGRLTARPAPKDVSWDDFVTLMTQCGFESRCGGGSHCTFEHTSEFRFSASKTHPSGILKVYQVKAAVEALKKVGVIDDGGERSG